MKGFLDIETGGFSKEKNGVCEIALIAVDKDNNVLGEFHALIKPYTRANDTDELVSYKDDAMAIHGITLQELISLGQEVKTVLENLIAFMIKHNIQTIIGHNAIRFDFPFIEHLLNRFIDISNFPLTIRQVDTLTLAKDKIQLPSYSLPNLCAHFGIENKDGHRALGDSYATLELYKILIDL
jgi:DNA polymerase III epsilon subunit-like protein